MSFLKIKFNRVKSLKFLLIFSLFSIPCYSFPRNNSIFVRDSPKEVIDQVWQIIYRDYLDSTGKYEDKDWLELRNKLLASSYQSPDEAHEAIRGMLLTLDDPYTRFLDPKEFHEMKIDTTGELMGVGIQISVDEDTSNLRVVSPIEDTPASKAGIKANDLIVSINGELTKGMSVDRAVKLIRGKKGTSVTLGLRRGDEFFKVSLVRERIEIKNVFIRLNDTDYGKKIGYIRLKQFSANSSKEIKDAILELEKQNSVAYVLDLRSNPGGLLEASIDISRHWLDEGIIVSTQTKNGIKDIRRANGRALTSKPLVILVNEGTASASEIVSGAIQDNERGILVGKKTYGKGLVQSVRGLSDGSGLTVTVAKYLTPSGRDINKYGIHPNIEADLKLYKSQRLLSSDLGTYKDSQYVIAETALIRQISRFERSQQFSPAHSNLEKALK